MTIICFTDEETISNYVVKWALLEEQPGERRKKGKRQMHFSEWDVVWLRDEFTQS